MEACGWCGLLELQSVSTCIHPVCNGSIMLILLVDAPCSRQVTITAHVVCHSYEHYSHCGVPGGLCC